MYPTTALVIISIFVVNALNQRDTIYLFEKMIKLVTSGMGRDVVNKNDSCPLVCREFVHNNTPNPPIFSKRRRTKKNSIILKYNNELTVVNLALSK